MNGDWDLQAQTVATEIKFIIQEITINVDPREQLDPS